MLPISIRGYIFLFFIFHTALFADLPTPIVVQLDSETHLLPLYLSRFKNDQAALDQNYLDELAKILRFDLHYNGMTMVMPQESQKEKWANGKDWEDFGQLSQWKSANAAYVVKVKVKDRILSAHVLSTYNQSIKSISNITLMGDLRQDRRQIHALSDAIFKSLFNKNGIASTHILYAVKTAGNSPKSWNSEIFECDYDGGNPRQVTRKAGYCISPCYIPPKPGCLAGYYFYVSYQNGQPKIYISSLQEESGRRFSGLRGNQLMPTISQQRNQVAFIGDITGNPDLFLQAFNPESGPVGKPYQIFSAPRATQGSPAFSPDGRRVAFVSNKDGSPRIYVMEIPGRGADIKNLSPRLVSKINRENSAPAWSPDGSKLAYCSLTKSVRQIWVHDFDTNEERQVTQGPGNKENPTWAPNSLHLMFNSTGGSGSELYMVNLNQPEAVKVTSGSGEKRFPNWEPK